MPNYTRICLSDLLHNTPVSARHSVIATSTRGGFSLDLCGLCLFRPEWSLNSNLLLQVLSCVENEEEERALAYGGAPGAQPYRRRGPC